jgi:hypothetical protein
MKAAPGWFTYVKKHYKQIAIAAAGIIICLGFIYVKKIYTAADFGKTFGPKAIAAEKKLLGLQHNFELCAGLCHSDARFMQSIVFPEVMRYSSIKDGVEAESLRTLYVQFGKEYANFSIGQFQMKPSFAEEVEIKSKQLLADSVLKELQLNYTSADAVTIRQQRVERLQDTDWQLVYLTAFVAICNSTYVNKIFSSPTEKLQWYATVYNAGFNKTDTFISKKIAEDNFYLNQQMPGKKFKYAAIAGWYYTKTPQ